MFARATLAMRGASRRQISAPVLMFACAAWLAGCGSGAARRMGAIRRTPPPLVGTVLANPFHGRILLEVDNATAVEACFSIPATYVAGRREGRASTACRHARLLHRVPGGYPTQTNLTAVFKNAVWIISVPHGVTTGEHSWHFRATATGRGGAVRSTVFAAHYPSR